MYIVNFPAPIFAFNTSYVHSLLVKILKYLVVRSTNVDFQNDLNHPHETSPGTSSRCVDLHNEYIRLSIFKSTVLKISNEL